MTKLNGPMLREGEIRPVATEGVWTTDSVANWIVADLKKSGITPEGAENAHLGYTCSKELIARILNRRSYLPGGSCLVIPYLTATSAPTDYYRIKPERPRVEKRNGVDRAVKYDSASGRPAMLYIPPVAIPKLANTAELIVVTEGEKKAIVLNQHGFLAVAVAGVWNLLKKKDGVETGKSFKDYHFAWPEIVPIAGRSVILAFDSDTRSKSNLPSAIKYMRQHLCALGAIVRVATIPDGPNGEKLGADDFIVAKGPSAFRELLVNDRSSSGQSTSVKRDSNKEKPLSTADMITEIGLGFDLWHDSEEKAYASIGRRSYSVKSKIFRSLLVARYRQQSGQKVPNAEALSAAILAIEGTAIHDRPEQVAYTRVAEHGDTIYVHLADENDTVIAIGINGWQPCSTPPVRFLRTRGIKALPTPQRGGKLEDLRSLINVPEDGPFALVCAWLAQSFRAKGPYPLLVLLGEQGSAKSTTARVLKGLTDPRALDLRAEQKDLRDLMVACRTNWVLAFDNLSHIPALLSDSLCRLSTGGGFGTRELYSDDEETTFQATRPVILNGIEDFLTRSDLLDRAVIIHHPIINEENRRTEKEIWDRFESESPRVLGAIFDYLAGGLRSVEKVSEKRRHRMADFALFANACEIGLKGTETEFEQAYRDNQSRANEAVLEDSAIVQAVRKLMESREEWRGTSTELLAGLTQLASESDVKDRDWPKRPNALSNRLKRLAPNLRRAVRIDVQIGVRDTDRARTRHTLIRWLQNDRPPRPSDASALSEDGDFSNQTADKGLVDIPMVCRPQSDQLPTRSDESTQRLDGTSDDGTDADDPSGVLVGHKRNDSPFLVRRGRV